MSERHLRRCVGKVGATAIAPLQWRAVPPRRDRRRAAPHPRQGADALRPDAFSTHAAPPCCCGLCGVRTHHRRRADPGEYGCNVGCLEGMDPYVRAIAAPVDDGVQHPPDRAAR
ncbi:GFA family protein [Xanthomonas theicola]|uniref:Uncharacterized protein n=1 Tax=Xanthomonas theicola TaxID=56464 RepID=A0A2S6ZHF1_9XANT|nr:GFA family protein [Xanthomonas theicola]PPT91681.1 hypothetical protein XthCFBP4691_06495 [Xanthomonas theicola]QNH26023.1 GFA family protein [Xanthomonas theicola]